MNAPLHREVLLRTADDGQAGQPLSAPGVQRYLWASRYGQILIEVINGQVRVNGAAVEPAVPTVASPPDSGTTAPR